MLEQFREVLDSVLGQSPNQLHPSFSSERRLLSVSEYLSLFLFGLYNPAIRTMRGLCAASRLKRVQEEICGSPVSLGSFSEAQHLLDPQLLDRVFTELAAQLPKQTGEGQLGQWQWLARDGSLFAALARMDWALYGGGKCGAPNRAVRLHLSLNIVEDKPEVATVRVGKECERKVWREQWKKGQGYVGDRIFGQDYRLLGRLNKKQCAYVLRLREKQAIINVLEELRVTEADQKAGVIRQAWAILGSTARYQSVRVRVVWIQTKEGSPLILVTNLDPEELSAEWVSLLYRKRWQIELFFRWIKCILGCRHWLAESPRGVAIQIYLALIAALLLQLYLGKRPNKRMMELIQLHQMGIATDDELKTGLEKQLAKLAALKKS